MRKFPAIDIENYLVEFNGYKYTISFVGNPSEDFCLETLCYLSKIFKNKFHIFSTEKDFSKSVEKIKRESLLSEDELMAYEKSHKIYKNDDGDEANGENEAAKIYNATRINLNFYNKKRISLNLQLFEIIASGGFVITNENEDLEKYFELSKQLETFKSNTDLVDKIDFYLKNFNIAEKISKSGKFKLIKNIRFTIKNRKKFSK